MKTSLLVLSLLAGALALGAGCKSKNTPDPGKSARGPASTVKEDPPDRPDPKPVAKPDAAALVGDPLKPGERLPLVTINIVNRSGGDLFTPTGRSYFNTLSLERFADGKWESFSYRLGVCGRDCPTDGSKPPCPPCLPSMPAAGRIPAKATLSHTWGGTLLYTRNISASCYCSFHRKAPFGRYRATICLFPGVQGELLPETKAKKTVHTLDRRPMSGDKICKSAEFVYSSKHQTVEIVYKK